MNQRFQLTASPVAARTFVLFIAVCCNKCFFFFTQHTRLRSLMFFHHAGQAWCSLTPADTQQAELLSEANAASLI